MILLLATAALAQEANWWTVERNVARQLFSHDVGAWARALDAAGMPDSVHSRMTRFQVFARADHERGQRRVIRALRGLAPHVLADAVDFLIRREDWAMARFAMEQWPDARPDLRRHFLRIWAGSAKPEVIDRWLSKQAERSRHWVLERLTFRYRLGTAGELVAEAEAAIRKRPEDLDGVLFFLDMLDAAGAKPDLGWITKEVRPRLARDSLRLGSRVLDRAPRVGIALLERALRQPYTVEDQRDLTVATPLLADPEQQFRDGVKFRLMRAYLRVGEAAKSQGLLEELSERYPDGLPTGLLGIAGQVQRQSGARVIEGRVRAAEEANKDDPLYWLGRAQYFAGRKEHRDADEAFEEAWRRRTDATATRILHGHARHRFRVGGASAAFALLRVRIEKVELDGPLAASIVREVLYYGRHDDDNTLPEPKDELWWRYLERRPVWGAGGEKRLLVNMAGRVAKADGDAFWSRTEALAAESHPSRATRIGLAMTRHGMHRRAIPLLQDAMRRLENESDKHSAGHACFAAYLALGEWKSAEGLLSDLRSGLGAREIVEQYSRLARTAARAGATRDALRLWRARTNFDRGDLRYVDEMVAAGMRGELETLYRKLGATRALARVRTR